MMMQFVCTARSADDEDYRPLAETPLTLDFAYDHGVSTLADPAVWQVTLTNNRSFLHRLGGWSALIASATPQPSCWTADGGMGSRLRHISCAKTACCNPGSPAGRERSHSLQALPAH